MSLIGRLLSGLRSQGTGSRARKLVESARYFAAAGDLAGFRRQVGALLSEEGASIDSMLTLATAASDAGLADLALQLADRAITLDPGNAVARFKRGLACRNLGRPDEAEADYREAAALDPAFGMALNNLGCLQFLRGDRRAARESFERAVAADAMLAQPQCNLGYELLAIADTERALACFRRAIALEPDYAEARALLCQTLLTLGRTEEAEAAYHDALGHDRSLAPQFALMLPEFMHSTEAIVLSRERFSARLAELEAGAWTLDDPLMAVPNSTWFYLAYHGMNDRALMTRLAAFLLRACPSLGWEASHCIAPRRSEARPRSEGSLRLGFVSSHLRDHTVGKLNLGVIENLSRDRFEVCVFVTQQQPDAVQRQIQRCVKEFAVLAPGLADARAQIAACGLDILYYPDIGMESFTYFLAFSRLAPLQCATWGHPMTTGIPAIDCFLSHAHCELPGSDQYYSERLLTLPAEDALTCYVRPETAGPDRRRAHFGLSDADTIYLCPQTLFKLHPDQDAAFRAILAADPRGVLVFLEGDKPLLKNMLLARLERAIPEQIGRVRFVPQQPYADFLQLLRVADVVLDTFVFGGGNSSMEAFAMGRAVVTLPSDQLRGRLTLTCCRRMGIIEELVATDAADYVGKAVRLGTDTSYRQEVERRIAARSDRLFDDRAMVAHLGALLERALERRLAG